jgi:2-polyprenyl-6-methoxyphenol hydroxylase-like FAD-dependent oxidoreductase
MTMNTTDEVLVVGAGPVGLTTACQLARHGVPVRVVDSLEQLTTESRAVGVHARSLEMLAALGVLPQLESRGRRIDALGMLDGRTGATRTRIDVTGIPSRHPYVLDVAQPDTEAVLAERTAELGVVVERGVTLTALAQDTDGVEVTLRSRDGEQTARVGWVVGADGGHSTTRALAGARLQGGLHGQHFPWPTSTSRPRGSPTPSACAPTPMAWGSCFRSPGAEPGSCSSSTTPEPAPPTPPSIRSRPSPTRGCTAAT